VKLAEPARDVVAMVGDGTYLMMNSELVTAVAEQVALTVVLVDNHGYQCILGLQRIVGVADFGNELRFRDRASQQLSGPYVPVDFRKHAESMGAHAVVANTAAELRAALADPGRKTHVTVIVVPVDPEKRMPGLGTWWDVPVAEVSADERTRQTREQYKEAAARQRPILVP
jgi:3D-(3,5/4)-trihydroxycyclohexane-1,2-dione acylhydrolase (decyclizing)